MKVTPDGIQRVTPGRGARIIHVETPLGIVNIHIGGHDVLGRRTEAVTMTPNRYAGEGKVLLQGNLFVECKTVDGTGRPL